MKLIAALHNMLYRLRDREGQTMAEYALILGGIAIIVIAAVVILGGKIADLFTDTGSTIENFPSS